MRAGVKPPNHARSNIAAVKEQSSLNNLRKQAEQQQHVSRECQGAIRAAMWQLSVSS